MKKGISNLISIKKQKYFIFSFVAIVIFMAFFIFMPKTRATYGDNIYGYAWSDGIGWISLNSCTDPSNPATCSTKNPYGVKYNSTTGLLSGYAWSENIGWIQFGGLSGFPSGTGTASSNAKIVVSGANAGQITGWARALSPDPTNDSTCPTLDSDNDGCWDGWISLSGTGYGVKFNLNTGMPNNTLHYGWGSNVIGWVDFSQARVTALNPNNAAAITFFTGPSCVLTNGANANQATLKWATTGMSACSLYMNGSIYSSIGTIPLDSSGTTVTVTPPSSTFVLRCCADSPGLCADNNGTNYSSDPLVITDQAGCVVPTTSGKAPKVKER